MVAWGRKGEHVTPLVQRDLGDDVCRGAESIDAYPRARPGHPICAVTDQPGTQERRDMHIVILAGSGKQKRASATANSAYPPLS